jgi:hypothetical protein
MSNANEARPILTWANVGDDLDSDWEDFCSLLTETMQKINPKGQWRCTVRNFGWMKQNGSANVKATNAENLLAGVLPKTQCNFKVFIEGKGFGRYLKIQNWHHDNNDGDEVYEIRRFNGRIHPAS